MFLTSQRPKKESISAILNTETLYPREVLLFDPELFTCRPSIDDEEHGACGDAKLTTFFAASPLLFASAACSKPGPGGKL